MSGLNRKIHHIVFYCIRVHIHCFVEVGHSHIVFGMLDSHSVFNIIKFVDILSVIYALVNGFKDSVALGLISI